MRVTVNISNDFSVGVLLHNVLAPPAVPVPAPMLSIEIIAFQFWPPGYAMNQNKLTTTVKHKGMSIVQDGHDCGALIPDITPPVMPNLFYTIMWPFSSRKIVFGASTVKMNGQSTGCSQMLLIPLPMMTCGDPVSAPLALPAILQKLNTVEVGMTWTDILAGLAGIAISMVIDLICHGVSSRGVRNAAGTFGRRAFSREAMEQVAGTATRSVARELLRQGIGKLIPITPDQALKFALSGLSGFASRSIQGNPTYQHTLGSGPLTIRGTVGGGQDATGQVDAFGLQRDTSGGGSNWGTSL